MYPDNPPSWQALRQKLLAMCLPLVLSACGGSGGDVTAEIGSVGNAPATASCGDSCRLTTTDVDRVVAQAILEAQARNQTATIAVTDRVGNVLAVFRMNDANRFVTVTSTSVLGGPIVGGLEDLNFIPSELAAIAKAITAAYLSTTESAFSTRSASQIIQEHFNPGEQDVPSGPLFGVQFSQLPCGDFIQRFNGGATPTPGPHRSPLGLSADPGGLPLYIEGIPVGGVGVVSDGIYGLDKIITDFDRDNDELIALAGSAGYAAPLEIRADRITVLGKTIRFSDARVADLDTGPPSDLNAGLTSTTGSYITVPGYHDGGAPIEGTVFGTAPSGISPADAQLFQSGTGSSLDGFAFVDAAGNNRYPATSAGDAPDSDPANRLSADEVQVLMNEALDLANQSRAQIRLPPGTQARVTIAIVDTSGTILGMVRSRDAPVFGADVALQKARTAAFFSGTGSSPAPADQLRALPPPLYLSPLPTPVDLSELDTLSQPSPFIADYVDALQTFLGLPDALEAFGAPLAVSDRAGGNLSRPEYPDGPGTGPNGPLSKPEGEWSVFSTGLQLDLVYNAVIHHIGFVLGVVPDVGGACPGNTGFDDDSPFDESGALARLANGVQIFPGSVPIYRGNVLVGGMGVSGDGVDQDDMIAFLGLHRAAIRLSTGIGNAPVSIRADQVDVPGQAARLRYVNCPQLPFIHSNETEVCNGL